MIIYKTTNLINGKIYVGQHFTSADDGYLGSGLVIKKAISKYGKQNFKREILEHVNEFNANEKETYWIDILDAINTGYNLTRHANGLNAAGRLKRSLGMRGKNNPFFGKKHPEEIIKKIVATRRKNGNLKCKEETKEKLSKVLKGRPPTYDMNGKSNPMYGKKHSKESKKKMSLSARNRKKN
jgi:group I intron endonuclease